MLLAVNYHYIREDFYTPFPAIFGKTPKQFKDQLGQLDKLGTFISAEQLNGAIREGKSLPEKSILLTFDDGLKEQAEIAVPILNEMGVPATFFINTKVLVEPTVLNVHLIHIVRSLLSPKAILEIVLEHDAYKALNKQEKEQHRALGVAHYLYDEAENAYLKYILNFALDRTEVMRLFQKLFKQVLGLDGEKAHQKLYLNTEDLKDLAKFQGIGSHSHDHLPIGTLSEAEARAEVLRSKQILENIQLKINGFSYPYGSKEAIGTSQKWLGELGFSFAVTMNRGVNNNLDTPFLLKRCDNNDVIGGKSYQPELIKPFLL
jgi:peptidoglycan/xylan/chitin deacetylase (PgdA/CDA1 family)